MKYFLLILTACTHNSLGYDVLLKPVDTKLKVMIIDSGVDSSNKEILPFIPKKYLNTPAASDELGHGTHIFWLIAQKSCDKVELIPCKGFDGDKHKKTGKFDVKDSLNCLQQALDLDVHIINFSGGGRGFILEELEMFKKINNAKIVVSAAAGNNGNNLHLTPFYPASYRKHNMPNIFIIGALNSNNGVLNTSNRGFLDIRWELGEKVKSYGLNSKKVKMTGTSQSAAIFTSKVVEHYCR
jgi:hypothetical protein